MCGVRDGSEAAFPAAAERLAQRDEVHGRVGLAARAYDPASGRFLELYTTQPGLQFYTSNGLNGSVAGKGGRVYRQTDAFALEAEHFPDSPNHPSFPTTVLKRGQTLHEVTVWRVGAR